MPLEAWSVALLQMPRTENAEGKRGRLPGTDASFGKSDWALSGLRNAHVQAREFRKDGSISRSIEGHVAAGTGTHRRERSALREQ